MKTYCSSYLLTLVLLGSLFTVSDASAQAPSLGTAENFGVLAGSSVTNTGPTILQGDLGVSPGTAVVGFPPGVVTGTIHANDAVAQQAQADLTTAYTALAVPEALPQYVAAKFWLSGCGDFQCHHPHAS